MRAPLTVRINDGITSRMVTKYVRGLRFRKTAPGGHADASCRLTIPSSSFSNLGPANSLYIYDARNTRTIWDGYTTNPGSQKGRTGEGYDLSALGGPSRLADKSDRFVFLDQQLTSWTQDTIFPQAPSGTAQASIGPELSGPLQGEPCLYLQFNPSQPIGAGSQVGLVYTGLDGAVMRVGGLVGNWDCGVTNAGYRLEWCVLPNGIPVINNGGLTMTGSGLNAYAGGLLDTGGDKVLFRMVRIGAATNIPAVDTYWGITGDVTVIGQLVDRYGVDKNMATTVGLAHPAVWLYANQIVEHLLGQAMTFCDPVTSVIEAASFKIDQLAYPSGAKPSQVLEDLSTYEGGMLYEVLERNPVGLHRFNYRAWPTTEPRYLIPADVPIEQPGSDLDLCNRIQVSWTDAGGKTKVLTVTSVVPDLGSRVRDADPIELPEGQGSAGNALGAGLRELAAKATAPKAARVVVDQPVMDTLRGVWAQPWEIEPGYLASLASTGDLLRLTEMEYDDDSCSASLVLGEPVLTRDQRLARLARVA